MSEESIIDFRIQAAEKKIDKQDQKLKDVADQIIEIRISLKDLAMIKQIVFGLVGFALLAIGNSAVELFK